jgi:hypothetical protein
MFENPAGNNIRRMAQERRMDRRTLGLLGFVVLAEIILFFIWVPLAIGFPVALFGLWAVNHYFIDWMDFVFRREQDAIRGAQAEEQVGAILDRLSDCEVLHGVRAKYGDIDHVVFRRDGAVFVIETKSYRGTITEARAANFLKQTHGNIFWLRDLLKARFDCEPWINASIVFTNAAVRVPGPLRRVEILSAGDLKDWISKAHRNPQVARRLWPQMDQIKAALTES